MKAKPVNPADILEAVRDLKSFDGPPAEFWARYVALLGNAAAAEDAILLRKTEGAWNRIVTGTEAGPISRLDSKSLGETADKALLSGWTVSEGKDNFLCGLRLEADDTEAAALFLVKEKKNADAAAVQMLLLSTLPSEWVAARSESGAEMQADICRTVLEATVSVFACRRYKAACIKLCSELMRRFHCDRVSLGMLKNRQYACLETISNMVSFDRKTAVVKDLEMIMEEALDQDEELSWPPLETNTAVTRAHEQFSRQHGTPYMCSIPLRVDGKPAAAFTCERSTGPFSETEIRQLSMIGEMTGGRIMAQKKRARWLIARMVSGIRNGLAALIGFEHTWLKVAGVLTAAGIAVLIFTDGEYRLKAPFILKAEEIAYLSAPTDGFVEAISADAGDEVKKSAELARLDRKALLLEKAYAVADIERYTREAEKNRADGKLADMKINRAQARQAEAKQAMINYRLDISTINAPFDGVVVESEWHDKAGSSVARGDVLMKLARLDKMYIEIELAADDISHVKPGMTGEITFISDPGRKYRVTLEKINPAAVTKPGGTVFKARAVLESDPLDWWRPGMSGTARLNAGSRSLWWIFTHKTEDFIRRTLWW